MVVLNIIYYGKGQTITRPAADDGGLLAEPVGGAGGAEGRLDAEGAGRPRDDDDRFERSR